VPNDVYRSGYQNQNELDSAKALTQPHNRLLRNDRTHLETSGERYNKTQ